MNIRELDLNLLLVFEAIFSTGNISRAAEWLDLSQPALKGHPLLTRPPTMKALGGEGFITMALSSMETPLIASAF